MPTSPITMSTSDSRQMRVTSAAVAQSRSSSHGSLSTGFTDQKSINADGVREPFDVGATIDVLTRNTINEEMIKKYKVEIDNHEKEIGTYEMKINSHQENMDRFKAEYKSLGETPASLPQDIERLKHLRGLALEAIKKEMAMKKLLRELIKKSMIEQARYYALIRAVEEEMFQSYIYHVPPLGLKMRAAPSSQGSAHLRQHIVPTAERFVQSPDTPRSNVSAPQNVRPQYSETTVFFYSTGGYDEALRPLIETALEPCAEKGYVDYETEWRVQKGLIGVNVVFMVAAQRRGAAEAVHDALAGIRRDLEAKFTGGGSKEIRPC